MVTRVVAKQGKTTKVKNSFINGRKNSKEDSVVFLMEGEKFNLSEKIQANSSVCLRTLSMLSVLLGRHTA